MTAADDRLAHGLAGARHVLHFVKQPSVFAQRRASTARLPAEALAEAVSLSASSRFSGVMRSGTAMTTESTMRLSAVPALSAPSKRGSRRRCAGWPPPGRPRHMARAVGALLARAAI